jgi:hypothetical protein
MEDSRVPILREWYSTHVASPEYVVLELDQYLPRCFGNNDRSQLICVSLQEYLAELPELIRFTGTAKDTLEHRLDELAADIWSQFPNYRDQPGIVGLVEDTILLLLNVGDELFHRLYEYRLYQSGGFHHYQFDRILTSSTIALRKMEWPRLVQAVTHESGA